MHRPFWTFTPTFSQRIRIRDLRIYAPMNVIGNTDGIDISSSRDAVITNVLINNSDDGICMNSGAESFGTVSSSYGGSVIWSMRRRTLSLRSASSSARARE